MLELRPATADDLPLLRAMLVEAAFWRSNETPPAVDRALEDPLLERYIDAWPRDGDFGVVAAEDAALVGAAWGRLFIAEEPGYGFVDETVPEITVAVRPGYRGQGTGTALLRELLRQARDRGIGRVSLSVERDNPSVSLYERLGFERLESVGNAWTMVRPLEPGR